MERFFPSFSIIVPTYNRPRELTNCLQTLRTLDYPRDRFEVIIVDDGSESPPGGIIKGFRCHKNVVFVTQAHGGPAAARNTGAQHAQGQFLAFIGDDCSPRKDWLRAFAARFETAPDIALGGSLVNGLTSNPYSTATHLLIRYLYTYYNSSGDNARFFTPNNLAVPANRFSLIGGFDGAFDLGAGEDREFCDRWRRRGYRMAYAPEAIVMHSHALTFQGFLQLHANYGRGTSRYRTMLAWRTGNRVQLEPLWFYLDLLRYPLSEGDQCDRFHLTLLLGISQIANAMGYFSEYFDRRRV